METTIRQTSATLTQTAIKSWHGDAFELVRRVRLLSKDIYFRVAPNNNFPLFEIAYYKKIHKHWEISVNFMGLVGYHGVLPAHYQAVLTKTLREKNSAFADFLDIFHNRLIHLYYATWSYARPTLSYQLTLPIKKSPQPLDRFLTAIAGSVMPHSFLHSSLLRYSGLLRRRPLARHSIETILGDFFKLPISVVDFVPQQVMISDRDKTQLSKYNTNNQLGCTTILGAKVHQQQSSCRLIIGPLTQAQFNTLLPGAKMMQQLTHLVRYLIPLSVQIHVMLIVHYTETPQLSLSKHSQSRLGLTTWCRNHALSYHATDVVYRIN